MLYLKQSTAGQIRLLGPFVDSTDGDTAETGLTIANTDIRLSKNGANIAAKNSGGATHDELGYYAATFNATDSNTVGALQVVVKMAGALPVYHEFTVLEEAVYDALFGAAAAGYAGVSELATVDANVDAILVDTAVIGAAGAGLTAVPWNAAWDAEVQSEAADALVAYDPPTKAELDSGLAALNDLSAAAVNAEVDTALADYDSPTKAELDAGLATLNDLSAAEVNAEVDTALADIHLDHLFATDYDPGAKPGVATALLNELVENDGGVARYTVNSLQNAPSGSGASAEAIADAVLDEPLSGHATAGSLGKAIADTESDATAIVADTTAIGAAGAGLTAIPWNAAWDAEVQSEATDALVAYDPPTKAELDSGLAALNDLSAAEVNAEVDAAFTTQMADSVSADGSIPTRDQALLMISRFLFERSVVSTTVTVAKEDGSTSSMTFGLDDANNPTRITRSG